MAQAVLKDWKKALAYCDNFLLPNGDLPSSKTEDDYDEYVLQEMYLHFKGRTVYNDPGTISIEDDGNDDETPSASPVAGQATIPGVATTNPATNTAVITPSDDTLLPPMPEGYFFQGFFGFKLFGRFAPAEF
jgi:hypothetical protein